MKLFELIRITKNPLVEGGNVSSQSPGWQGAADQEAEEIDLKIHNRDFMVNQIRSLLKAQNKSFKATYGRYIWDPKLLDTNEMFSGSSLQFFDVKGVSTQDFINKLKKTKVGDIDTQVDQEIGDEITAWLKSIIGKKIGNGTFLGFNSSLSSIWLLDNPQVRIQVDYELGPYNPATDKEPAKPSEWFAYSHSSDYDDMAAGIKGVFHKYINRALTSGQKSTKYVARVLKKGVKFSETPTTDNDYSFAVTSAQGGGLSKKYKPYIDPNTGEPMQKDGIPVMQLLDPKDRDYIQNLDQQFQITYGRKRSENDRKLQRSFVGTLQLMNRAFTPEQNESVARAFIEILFGPGVQMITKDDPERDRDIKFAAVDAMLLGGNGIKPLNLPNNQQLRKEAVQMAMDYADQFKSKKAGKVAQTEVAEDAEAEAAAKPNYARQGIKHLYNRLSDGRVSSMEMSNTDFLEIAKEIAANGGTLNEIPINLKVDGAGIRFGKDQAGRPFFMTSKVTTPLYKDDVGFFTSFGQQKGQDAEQLARTQKYDQALDLITSSKFIETLPPDTIVQAEMMYNPMAETTPDGLKFVNIAYDPKKLGKEMTLVPFTVKQYSTGDIRPDADKIKKKLLDASNNNIKIVSNDLEQRGINVGKIIDPILSLDPKKKENRAEFDRAKQELSNTIIDNPKLAGKDVLGTNLEGIVVNMPSGRLFKITSQQMKSAMAAKMTQTDTPRQGPEKTAVVAVGSFAGHLGHEDLFKETIKTATELNGDPYLFIGNAVGKDDPIPTQTKLATWHKLYPEYANNISTVTQGGSLMQKIKHELVNPRPGQPPKYDNIIIMVGEDRKDMTIPSAVMKAVNKFPGYEHVKVSLKSIPRTRPVSFTNLRNVLKNTNLTPEQQYSEWSQKFNEKKLGKDWILHLMAVTKQGMGLVETNKSKTETRLLNTIICPHLSEKMLPKSAFAGTEAPWRHKLGPAAQAKGKQKGPVKRGQLVGDAQESIDPDLEENLRKWFKEKWVRFGPDGKIRGDCARGDDSEGKPKCLPQSKAHALGKKGRASAAARKRREDPNPERKGSAINVATKKNENAVNESAIPAELVRRIQHLLNTKYGANLDVDGKLGPLTLKSIKQFLPARAKSPAPDPDKTTKVQGAKSKVDELKCWPGYTRVRGVPAGAPGSCKKKTNEETCPHCGGPMFSEELVNEKKDACYYKVRSRYKVWPSAYASGALVQCRKRGAKNWGSKNESSIPVNETAEQIMAQLIDKIITNEAIQNNKPKS